jgi:ureidoglycolate hydrolase
MTEAVYSSEKLQGIDYYGHVKHAALPSIARTMDYLVETLEGQP